MKILNFAIIFLVLFTYSENLLSQKYPISEYGFKLENTENLSFKVKIETIDSKKIKGFLASLNENSIAVSITKFVAVNRKESSLINIPISNIKTFKIIRAGIIAKHILIAPLSAILASLGVEGIVSIINGNVGYFGFGFATIVLSILYIPLSIIIGCIIGSSKNLKISLNGNQNKYDKEMIKLFMKRYAYLY